MKLWKMNLRRIQLKRKLPWRTQPKKKSQRGDAAEEALKEDTAVSVTKEAALVLDDTTPNMEIPPSGDQPEAPKEDPPEEATKEDACVEAAP